MKRLTIFLTIFITLTMGLIAFFGVKTNAQENEINSAPITIVYQESIKLYFSDFADFVDPGHYIDFTFLPDYYDYFIFYFYDGSPKLLSYGSTYQWTQEVFTGMGLRFTERYNLNWSFYTEDYTYFNEFYVLATNYEYIYNLPNNLYNEHLDGYYEGYDDGVVFGHDDAYDEGYDDGYFMGHSDGTNETWIPAYNEGYYYGYDEGYDDGFNDSENFNFTGLLSQVFIGLGSLLSIQLLPNISIGAIIAVPIVFGIIAFIIGKRGGKGD